MATLIVKDGRHSQGANHLTVETNALLVVAGDYLLHAAAAMRLYNHTLNISDTRLDHGASHLDIEHTHVLTVNEAYHLHAAEKCNFIYYYIGVDPYHMMKLPVIEVEAKSGYRIYTASNGVRTPGLKISARVGSRADRLKFPTAELTATATHETLGTLDKDFPSLSLSARSGIRGGAGRLPALTIDAEISSAVIGRLNKNLPGLEISASGYRARSGTLDADLPALELSATMYGDGHITLDRKIPTLKLTAAASHERLMSLDENLPALQISASGASGYMTVNGYIPPPVMVSFGDSQGGVISTVHQESMFDDYVLRYVR